MQIDSTRTNTDVDRIQHYLQTDMCCISQQKKIHRHITTHIYLTTIQRICFTNELDTVSFTANPFRRQIIYDLEI